MVSGERTPSRERDWSHGHPKKRARRDSGDQREKSVHTGDHRTRRDRAGSDLPRFLQEEVLYLPREEAFFPVSKLLFIGNLRLPLDMAQIQDHWRRLARPHGGLKRAWFNQSRCHALVLLHSEAGAEAIRIAMVAKCWAHSRIPLFVDFVPVAAMKQWIFEEDAGPEDGKWRVDYYHEGGDVHVSHTLLNGTFDPENPPRIDRYNNMEAKRPYDIRA